MLRFGLVCSCLLLVSYAASLDESWAKRLVEVLDDNEENERKLEAEALAEFKKKMEEQREVLGEATVERLRSLAVPGPYERKSLDTRGQICTKTSASVGGWAGHEFSELRQYRVTSYSRVTGFEVRAGNLVDCIGLGYGKHRIICNGGEGGTRTVVYFDPNEVMIGISGRAGELIDQVVIHTTRKEYGPYGGDGGEPFRLVAPAEVAYMEGKNFNLISSLQLHYLCCMQDN